MTTHPRAPRTPRRLLALAASLALLSIGGSTARAQSSIFDDLDGAGPAPMTPGGNGKSPAGATTDAPRQPSAVAGVNGAAAGRAVVSKGLPVPVAPELPKLERQVRDEFRADFAKAAPVDRAALGRKLMERADQNPSEAPVRYVMLREARDAAATGGDVETALVANDRIAAVWAVDGLLAKHDVLAKAARSAVSPDARAAVAKETLAAMDDAHAAGRYELLGRLSGVAETAAERVGPGPQAGALRRRAGEARLLRGEFERAKLAAAKLKRNPADGESSAAAGLFLCLAHRDWAGGLPMLTLATDPHVRAAGEGELAKPAAGRAQVAVADAWAEVARALPAGYLRTAAEDRAASWYHQALPVAPDAERAVIRGKLEALPGQVPFARVAAAAKSKATENTRLLGGGGPAGREFTDVPAGGSLLVGLIVSTRSAGGKGSIASVQPVYLTPDGRATGLTFGKPEGRPLKLDAREGYAVGALVGRGGADHLEAVKVVFMRVRGGTLDPTDAYESEWAGGGGGANGGSAGGKPATPEVPTPLADGRLAIGIHGKADEPGVTGLGLVRMR